MERLNSKSKLVYVQKKEGGWDLTFNDFQAKPYYKPEDLSQAFMMSLGRDLKIFNRTKRSDEIF